MSKKFLNRSALALALLVAAGCSARFGVADAETTADSPSMDDAWDPYANTSLDNGSTHLLGESDAALDDAERPATSVTDTGAIPPGSGAVYTPTAELADIGEAPLFPAESGTVNAASLADADFIARFHTTNLREMEMGRLAAEKGESPWIRSYGRRVAMDHAFADRRLTKVAADGNVDISAFSSAEETVGYTPNLLESAEIQRLRTLNGPAFDDEYMRVVRVSHDEKIQLLEAAKAQLPRDASIRKLITKMLPIMEQHRAVADTVMIRRLETAQL